jgi:hypothetical protein
MVRVFLRILSSAAASVLAQLTAQYPYKQVTTAEAGGVEALATLVRDSPEAGVVQKAVHALLNLAVHPSNQASDCTHELHFYR